LLTTLGFASLRAASPLAGRAQAGLRSAVFVGSLLLAKTPI
jgi:hypothetical protein